MVDRYVRTRVQRRRPSVLPPHDEWGAIVFAVNLKDFAVTLGFALMMSLHQHAIPRSCPKRTGTLGHRCPPSLDSSQPYSCGGMVASRDLALRSLQPGGFEGGGLVGESQFRADDETVSQRVDL